MKKLNTFLEAQDNEAHKKAQSMGLEYRGFGFWADPATGKVTHRSSGNDLNEVGGNLEATPGGDDGSGGADKASFDNQMQAGLEAQLGEVKPGEQKAKKEVTWKSGPDGDTDVGADVDEDDVEDDAFVSKGDDEDSWTAGPDGDNFTTVKSFDKMQEAANWTGKSQGEPLIPDEDSTRGSEAKHEAERRNLNSDGHGMWFDQANNPVAKTVDGKLVDLTPQEIKRHDLGSRVPGRTTMRDMVKGDRTAKGLMKNRVNAAKDNLAHLSPSERDKYIDAKMATKDGTYKAGKDKGPYHKANDGQRAVDQMTADDYNEMKEVEQFNEDAKQYFMNPDYDLSDDNLGEEIGEGAFGSVYLSEPDDGSGEINVIKDGQIGRQEMQALDMLKDIPGFPKLINATFTSTFKPISTWENDGITVDSGEGGTFWNDADAAMGRYAMTMADGQPVSDASYDWDEISAENATLNFWNHMAQMHKSGVSHNDLHGGNVFFNDELEPTILDLGLARVDKFSALMEALATQNSNNYQLSTHLEMNNLPQESIAQLEENRAAVIEMISDDYSDDSWMDEQREMLIAIMEGDIRLTDEKIDNFRSELEFDDEQLQGYLDRMYEGFGVQPDDGRPELVQRMEGGYTKMLDKIAAANGYKDGKAMAVMFNHANDINRKNYGKDIDFKGVDITRNPRDNK